MINHHAIAFGYLLFALFLGFAIYAYIYIPEAQLRAPCSTIEPDCGR